MFSIILLIYDQECDETPRAFTCKPINTYQLKNKRFKMSFSICGDTCDDYKLPYPFRSIFAGSSQSGKTHVAGRLCENFHLFEGKPKRIIYYYPRYLREKPVNWDTSLNIQIPLQFTTDIPTQDDIDELENDTLLVLDDLYDKAVNSECIDHLFRVTSGKRNLSVMIMTQNSYAQGRYARDIRNSCNMQVLLRNCLDTSINLRVCRALGLEKAYKAAEEETRFEKYPYFLINQSPKAHRSNFRLFTDIFAENPICWSVNGMKSYIISENDFRRYMEIKEKYSTKLKTFSATIKDDKSINRSLRKSPAKHKTVPRKRRRYSTEESTSSEDHSSSESDSEDSSEFFKPKTRRNS